MTMYRQVELRQDLGPGRWATIVTWVKSEGVRRGRCVTVEGEPGVWRIVETYDPQMEGAALSALRGEGREFQDRLDSVPGSC